MLRYFLRKKSKGFTLLEVIFTILVMAIALVGTFSLLTYTLALTTDISFTLTAAYLGQEGVEIVKNLRDGNWLKQRKGVQVSWDYGLDNGDWEADYNDQFLSPFNSRFLTIDANGFYNYGPETEPKTRFIRKITIFDKTDLNRDGNPDMLKVRIEVFWQERGRDKQIVVQENLYNWLQ